MSRSSRTPSSTLPRTSFDSSRCGSCSSRPTEAPGASWASPRYSVSWPAMMRSSVDLPAPLRPRTPIFAPGRKLSEMSRSTCLSGGCVRDSLYIWKMYWWPDTTAEDREGRLLRRSGSGRVRLMAGRDRTQHQRSDECSGERESRRDDERELEAIGQRAVQNAGGHMAVRQLA